MPIDLELGEKKMRVNPSTKWNKIKVDQKTEVTLDLDYYVGTEAKMNRIQFV